MVEPLFSSEEVEALRADLQQPSTRRAEVVDLIAGEHAFRKWLPKIERHLERFSNRAQELIGRQLRQGVAIHGEPPDLVGPKTARELLCSLSIVSTLQADNDGVVGFVGIDAALSFLLIERMFGAPVSGGDDNVPVVIPAREQLTDIERRSLGMMMEDLGGALGESLCETKIDLTVETLPAGLSPELPEQVEIGLGWEIRFAAAGHEQGRLVLILLPALVELTKRGDKTTTIEVSPSWLPGHLEKMNVEVSSCLGSVGMSVGELLSIRPGDLLRLDAGHQDPVPVMVEGLPKMQGRPTQKNGAFGVEIVAPWNTR